MYGEVEKRKVYDEGLVFCTVLFAEGVVYGTVYIIEGPFIPNVNVYVSVSPSRFVAVTTTVCGPFA